MSHVAQAIDFVRKAAIRFNKKPLADRAGLSDAILRNVHNDSFNPQAETLQKLEAAAAELQAEDEAAKAQGQRETSGLVPGAVTP